MLRNLSRWLDPIILVGLAVSVAIPIWMVQSGQDSLPSFMVGLLATILTLLIDIIARISHAETTLLDALRIGRLLNDEKLSSFMHSVKDTIDVIEDFDFPFYRRIANDILEECQTELAQIATGSVRVDQRGLHAYVFQGMKDATKSIKTVHTGNMKFWQGNYAQTAYWPQHLEAIKRRVRITRIFAITVEERETYRQILLDQANAGVQVYVTKPDRIDAEFVIFDDRVLVDLDVDINKDYRWERVVLNRTQVRKRIEEFDLLIDRQCTPFPPSTNGASNSSSQAPVSLQSESSTDDTAAIDVAT